MTTWQRVLGNPEESAYSRQLINSERGLQVYLCHELMNLLRENEKQKWRFFVEPKVTFGDGENRYPDLVICNSSDIIGVVELKYAPRARPDTVKDVQTLTRFYQKDMLDEPVELSNDRYLGSGPALKEYRLAKEPVLCWAGVYTVTGDDGPMKIEHGIGKSFLQLDAITRPDENPVLFADGKKMPDRSGLGQDPVHADVVI